MARKSITGALRLLLGVPKSALIDYLLQQHAPQALQTAIVKVTSRPASPTASELSRLTHSDVIRVFECSDGIPADAVSRLHEEYLYRGTKVLYIHEFRQSNPGATLNLEALNRTISDVVASGDVARHGGLRAFRFTGMESIGGGIVELRFSYVGRVRYTDPVTEYPTWADDLRRGFVWVSFGEQWLAICARDERVNNLLIEAFATYPGISASRLPIPKHVLQALEPAHRIRRATLLDPMTGTRRRYTNPRMAEDQSAIHEIVIRDERDERPTSGYNEELADGTVFAVGYSSDRGKVFFSRDLTVSQMRSWGPSRISELVASVRRTRIENPTVLVPEAARTVLKGFPAQCRRVITEIASSVIDCKKAGLTEVALPHDAFALMQRLGKHACAVVRVNCGVCEEPAEVRCVTCQSETIQIVGGSLKCQRCGHHVEPEHVECCEGHINAVPSLAELVSLIPGMDLRRLVGDIIAESSDVRLTADEDVFWVRGNRLFLGAPRDRTVYSLDEIADFAELIEPSVPESEKTGIRSCLGAFKERCRSASAAACAQCLTSPKQSKCFVRLLGLLDPDYRPRPHHGHEYADYSRLVSIGGQRDRQLVIVMKRGDPSTSKAITYGSTVGRELWSQLMRYLRDPTVDIVGIWTPRRLDDGLKAVMLYDAQRYRKKLVFAQDEEIVRVVYTVLIRRSLSLDDL